MSLIIVAGPAGAGKTTFARQLRKRLLSSAWEVASDAFLSLPRETRPAAMRELVIDRLAEYTAVVVEGCEALRGTIKGGLGPRISVVYWIECHQPKAECGGLTTQQERYLQQLRKERPDVPIYRVTNY